jgi:hypothetical protein
MEGEIYNFMKRALEKPRRKWEFIKKELKR